MAAVSWKNNISGDWDVPGNWSTGVLPGTTDDVTISTSSAQTITHSVSSDSIASLTVSSNDALSMTGGSLTVLGNATLGAAFTQSGGLFALDGVNSRINGAVTQTAGTISVASGTLHLYGTGNSFGGSLAGPATVDFAAGTDLLAAGLAFSLGSVLVSGASVTLGENITESGHWTQTAGTVALGANTLTVGTLNFDGGIITGSGTINATSTGELSTGQLQGTVVLNNTGNITQTSYVYDGVGGGDAAQINNKAGAVYTLTNNSQIYGTAASSFGNAGTLNKLAAGTSQIYVSAASTGTINIAAGQLNFAGTTNGFAGSIGGAGTLGLVGGTDALGPSLSLTVADVLLSGATATLGANLTYANEWTENNGSLVLNGFTFTSSGTLNLEGGFVGGAGTLAITKSASLSGSAISGSVFVKNTGAIAENSSSYVGYFAGDTPTLDNASGAATFTLANSANLYGTTGALFLNAGKIIKVDGGTSVIYVPTTSTNNITVSSGILSFQGATNSFSGSISGAGELNLSSGTDTTGTSFSLSVSHLLLSGTTLSLGNNLTYTGELIQTAGTLGLGGHTLTASGTANLDGGVINGTGVLSLNKATVFDGVALEGSIAVNNKAVATQVGYVYFGAVGGDTVAFTNTSTGSYTIVGNQNIYSTAGSSFTNAGKLIKQNGGGSQVTVSTTSTGSITVSSGLLDFTGATNSFSGTIAGAGTFELGSGNNSFGAPLTLSVTNFLENANLSLGADLTYAQHWTQFGGTLALGGHTLTESNTLALDGGIINGSGTVVVSGSAYLSNAQLGGSVVLSNTGNITQSGYYYLGTAGTDTASLNNALGATYTIVNNNQIYGQPLDSIVNAGSFVKQGGGISQVNVKFSSTGTVTVASGVLALAGPTNSLGGTVAGTGKLLLNSGTDTLASGLVLSVASVQEGGANVTLGGNLSYAGGFALTTGTLALGGHTLSTTGNVNLDGGVINGTGTLAIAGAADFATFALEGKDVIVNTGSITQTNYWYLGFNGTDTPKLINQAGAILNITNNSYIYASASANLTNSGTIEKTGGSGLSAIYVATINNATVSVGSGTLEFLAAVSGHGTFDVAANTVLQFGSSVAAGSVSVLGADAELITSASAGYAGSITGFAAGNLIELAGLGFSGTTLNYNTATHTLTATNGGTSVNLLFNGTYANTDFRLINDNGTAAIGHT